MQGMAQPQRKFRIVSKHDWSRFVNFYHDEIPLGEIFDKLDNHSLSLLYERFYCTVLDVKGLLRTYCKRFCDIIEQITYTRGFNLSEEQPVELNNPTAPLRRYLGETWVDHPLEKEL